MNKEIFIWYHNQNQKYIEEHLLTPEQKSLMMQYNEFFGYYKKKGFFLKEKYKIGLISIKKTAAFFIIDDADDLFVPLRELKYALNNDLVLVGKHYKEAYIIEVLKSNLESIVVDVEKRKNNLYFKSNKTRDNIIVVKDLPSHITDGAIIKLKVENIENYIISCSYQSLIGYKNDPGVSVLRLVNEYSWPYIFNEEVLTYIDNIKINMNNEYQRRVDLTNRLIFTIDGEDSKDLDDAISLEILDNNNYRLGVHIADVSLYVPEGSIVDQEAYNRGTSVYLADRVIPMLPQRLSNDLCSLNPNEIKLTMTCDIILDSNCNVIDYSIYESFIKSSHRLFYSSVNRLLKDGQSLQNTKQLDETLIKMNDIATVLRKARSKRGAIDFVSSELKFKIDENDKVISVEQRNTDVAEMLIESFMILANETVSKHLHNNNLPNIYRVHEKPDLTKLTDAFNVLSSLGYTSNHVDTNKKIKDVLSKVKNPKMEVIISNVLLRSMKKAKYHYEPIGHFGLSSKYYSHFTSPIRRYPDLILHRMIRQMMFDKTQSKAISHYNSILPDVSEHTSIQERNAINLERDVEKLKCCEYLESMINQTFKAFVIQSSPGSVFVRLENGIEGFAYYPSNNRQTNTARNRLNSSRYSYRLGDDVMVRLIEVNRIELSISFQIEVGKTKKKKNRKKKKSQK